MSMHRTEPGHRDPPDDLPRFQWKSWPGDTDGRQSHRVRVLVLAADSARAASVRRGLEGHPAIEVVGAVHHADAAVVACARQRIDVVVTVSEVQATETRLLQRAVAIRAQYPATRVVVALCAASRALLETLLTRPDGLLAASASSQEVRAVIGTAAAGHLAIGRSLRPAFFQACAPASEQPETSFEDLTPREVEIISAGARGMTSREIANQLHLAVNTVEKSLTVIYRKLQAHGIEPRPA